MIFKFLRACDCRSDVNPHTYEYKPTARTDTVSSSIVFQNTDYEEDLVGSAERRKLILD